MDSSIRSDDASVSRASAGTMSPSPSNRTSPGTIAEDGTSVAAPSRSTRALGADSAATA